MDLSVSMCEELTILKILTEIHLPSPDAPCGGNR